MSIRIGLAVSGGGPEGPDGLMQLVDTCKDSAIDSIWFSERHISRQPSLEPMTAMAVLAGRTERLKFGMNVVLLPFRDPAVLANECATLDYLSNGRLLPAFGIGGIQSPEWRAMGVNPAGRGLLADEMLQIMNALWAGESVNFFGTHFNYENATISPLPLRQPLPAWIGGSSTGAIRRTVRYGSGWLAGIQTPEEVAPVVAKIKAAAAESDRTIDDDHYGAGFPFRFGNWDEPVIQKSLGSYQRAGTAGPRELIAVGEADDIVARAKEYVDVGISKFILRPIGTDVGDVQVQARRLIDEVLPTVHSLE
jgi:probable F420-dependent oxidoreductase